MILDELSDMKVFFVFFSGQDIIQEATWSGYHKLITQKKSNGWTWKNNFCLFDLFSTGSWLTLVCISVSE